MIKRIFSSFLALILVTSSLTSASAVQTKKDLKWEERRAQIEESIIAQGSQDYEAVDNWLALNGIVKVEVNVITSEQSIGIQSSPGSVTLNKIDAYFDTLAKKYLIKGWWQWNGIGYVDTYAGALDGVSLAMANISNWNPVTGYVFASNPTGIAVYDQNGTYYSTAGSASKIDKSGILYTFQDKWVSGNYVGFKGQVWAWMDSCPTGSLYLKMDLEHTWSDANLSSFGFSWPSGQAPTINMSFNVVPSNFKTANQITVYSWPSK